ncbi:hypothetical protein DMB42_35555 [Nonomuraea sp. WAC 01424]|uniref:hypothetical protein n=1 Tax=Nonomuraea sp. WAC 01424 TaxID=2203200 RepID=UPI000F7BA457|nr:hypothetical protein [Nonomuraea sp. WAC 01424]RSN03145.1 hypothetical protein DMB42_35555 [Nonomuraea sp. WAC 01424]
MTFIRLSDSATQLKDAYLERKYKQMQIIVDWLDRNPEAKVNKAELFNCSSAKAKEIPTVDIHRVLEYVEALAERAAEYGAPANVKASLAELKERVRKGLAFIDEQGPYTQKTLASLQGLERVREARLVLRGALPHAPSEAERDLLMKGDEALAKGVERIESGGSMAWCLAGCILCAEGCLICCTIML